VKVRVTRSGRRHKVGNARILAAMKDAGAPEAEGDALVFIGQDDRGVMLHIVAVPDDCDPEGLAVIHCMPAEWKG
jgi:hypothetical protein